MICLKVSNRYYLLGLFLALSFWSCKDRLPEISPTIITEKTPHDTDDPAIWINDDDPASSIVFGTDKDEINGGVYAFDLKGNVLKDKSITGLSYPNNVDIAYQFNLSDSTSTDIMVFTEREKYQIRLFSVPELQPLDNGGFKVFEDEKDINLKRPMGVAIYTTPQSNEHYVIVSRKEGPKENYLYQYLLGSDSTGISAKLVRKFGQFSGEKEIEAIVVDNELGYIYYADEMQCIHKYYAHPAKGNNELDCFGSEYFERDIEGMAIAKYQDKGFLVVSDQQDHSFAIFDRTTNAYIKSINLGTIETDGCEITTSNLGERFPNGIMVSMNDTKEFYFHDLALLNLN